MEDSNKKTTTSSTSGEVTAKATATPATVRLDVLEQKAEDIEASLEKSEKRQNQALTFMMSVAGVIIIAFFLALIPILFDYYRDNTERYNDYTKRIDKLEYRVESMEKNIK